MLADLVEDDDAYTGAHTRGVVGLALAVADDLRVDDDRRPRSSSARCCTTSASSASPTRSSTSPAR